MATRDQSIDKLLDQLAKALNGTIHRVDWDPQVLPDKRIAQTGFQTTQNLGYAGPSLIGKLDERPISIEFEPAGELVVKLGYASIHWFRMVPYSFLSRLDFFSGRRVSSGNKTFDDAHIIRSDGSHELALWFSNAEILESITSLEPLIHLVLQRNLLRYRSTFDVSRLDATQILHCGEHLDSLASSVESLSGSSS